MSGTRIIRERVLSTRRFGTDRDGYRQLLAAGRRWQDRLWAVEGCQGVGRHLAQRLVTDGEPVVDVPSKLSARARVFSTGQGRKTDATDAHSVAVVALRTPDLQTVAVDDATVALRLLVGMRPRDVVGKTRRQLAVELVEELTRTDKKIKAANEQLRELVPATGSGLLPLFGIGPSGAARLLGDIGDIRRFPTREHFASWNGTAPIDASSGDQQHHRLSRAGNRRINRVLHMMAVVQLRHDTEGRTYYRRKLTAGKTPMEAMRALKRRLSNIVYRQLVADQARRQQAGEAGPGGHMGAATDSSAAGCNPDQANSIAAAALTRLRSMQVDGLNLYDVDAGADRTEAPRPFPLMPTMDGPLPRPSPHGLGRAGDRLPGRGKYTGNQLDR